MVIGYARISTETQSLLLQEDALKRAGCERIFHDVISGSVDTRKGLSEALAVVRPGDTFVVWRLDRLGRSLRHLIDTVTDLNARSIGFRSVQESIDTNSPGGLLVFHIFGALAEFERELIRERTKAGLAVARSQGRIGGRPMKMTPEMIEIARTLLANPEHGIPAVCRTLGVSRATLYRHIKNQ